MACAISGAPHNSQDSKDGWFRNVQRGHSNEANLLSPVEIEFDVGALIGVEDDKTSERGRMLSVRALIGIGVCTGSDTGGGR